ncbi:MAG: hypothetical protein MUC36_05625 [Planctomycetes bacterium]|jgi:hypothetical protein|nr:hypothetical protein [Planctomycetota bacterium]
MHEGRRPLAISLLVLIAIAAFAIWAMQGDGPVVDDLSSPPPSPAANATPAQAEPAPTPQRHEAAAVPEPTPPAVAPASDSELAHVRGRCVDETGAPLAACIVKLDGRPGDTNRMVLQGKVDWQDPEPIVTGVDGRFDFGFVPPSGMNFFLDAAAPGRVPRTGVWGQIAAAQIIALGDIALVRGFPVRGRVVDEHGLPVAKVGVGINNLPLPIDGMLGANNARYGWSDADGEFTIQTPLPVGTWSIKSESRGLQHVSPAHVTIAQWGADPLLVTVRRMQSIQGVVVDERGLPVQGAYVHGVRDRILAGGRSGADGTFTIYAPDAEPQPVRIRIDDPGPCEPPAVDDDRLWPWGSKDVRVELRRALRCELLVVERATGAPVTRFAVSCRASRADSGRYAGLRLSGDHPGGRVTIDRVWRGPNLLQVVPLDRALLPSAMVEFVANDAGVPPQRVEVERLVAVTVVVRAASGAPIQGSKIEVIQKGEDPWRATASARERGNSGYSSNPKLRPHELISEVRSGADGRANAFAPPGGNGLVVRVTGEHPPVVIDPPVFVIGQDLVVVPPAAGGITGVVRLQGLDTRRIQVSRRAGDAGEFANFDWPTPLQADGTFAIRGLLPGRYQLRLQYSVPFRTESGSTVVDAVTDVAPTEVVVQPDQDTTVEIDATALVPASVSGRVLLDDRPPAPARVSLQSDRYHYGQFVVADDGRFTAEGVLPGRYRIGLVVGDFMANEGVTMLQEESFELAAGQQLVRDFQFVRRRLVITLLQADGVTPATNLTCRCSGEGVRLRPSTTDAQGRLIIDPAPAVPLHIRPESLRVALGPVQVPPGQSSHAVTLTLPANPTK